MKKTLALLVFAAMIFSAGCGQTPKPVEDAKENANAAVEKVEQKVDETKKDAANKVDEMKKDAGAAADDAAAKVDETADKMKQDAENAANKVNDKVNEMASGAANKIGEMKTTRDISLGGIMPGIAVETAKSTLSNPVETNGDTLRFKNGLVVEVENDKVEKITAKTDDVKTAAGISVGMSEYSLNNAYGRADDVDVSRDKVEYTYYSDDKKSKIEFESVGGVITEIVAELND